MKRPRNRAPELIALQSCWTQWTTIVELFARRHPARNRVDRRAYAVAHRKLLACCRELARTADESTRAHYEAIEALASPWLTPQSLDRVDREILLDLLEQCRGIRREFGGRRWTEVAASWTRPLGWCLGLSGVGAALYLVQDGLLGGVVERLDSWVVATRVALRRSSLTERLGMLAVVVVIASIFVASRTSKS